MKSNDVSPIGHTQKMLSALAGFKQAVRSHAPAVIMERLDTWTNLTTGMGTARDKTTAGFILPSRWYSDNELSALYHHDDMAARMVDIVPQEMLREGFIVDLGDPNDNDAVMTKMEHLDAASAFEDGVRWGRCYGGAATIIGCDDGQDASLALVPEQADDVRYLYTVDRRLLWPMKRYDIPGDPRYGQPETYMVTSGSPGAAYAEIHESRLILFGGATTGIRERQMLNGWDASVLQRAYDTLRQFNVGWKSVEVMMTDGNQSIFTMTGLSDILKAPGGGGEMLRTRLQAMDMFRSVIRAIVLDADGNEKFERQSVDFASIPQTLDKFMLRLAATVEVPVTILMGQSPAGMNATGDSDFRWFYNRISSKQRSVVTPRARRVVDVWSRTRAGQTQLRKLTAGERRRIQIKFPSLWTETPLAESQRRTAIVTADSMLIKDDVLTADEVALQRMRPDGYERELILPADALQARSLAVEADYAARIAQGQVDDTLIDGAVEEKAIVLAPTDLASIITVNEGRASAGLPPLPGTDGEMSITEYRAKFAETIAAVAQAEQGADPADVPAQAGIED